MGRPVVSASDRRRVERFPTLLRCQLRVARGDDDDTPADAPAVVADVSRGGIFVATPTPAAIGQTVYFEFDGPYGTCLAVGNIIATRRSQGFAVEFQGETPAMKEFFDVAERLGPGARWSLLQAIGRARVETV